jgi:divalent metal cation (Fe/Co/Zn/Cd) transporter
MESVLQVPRQNTTRLIQRIQTVTILWMTVEASVSLCAAWMARSSALLAFGGDSAIELLSAAAVLWRFRSSAPERLEKQVARIAAALLFILAAYVAVVSAMTLLGHREAKTTYWGIAILIGAAALRADAAQSGLCAYLSVIALVGLVINAIWHIRWADPIAALVIVPLVLWEGWEAMRGRACACC